MGMTEQIMLGAEENAVVEEATPEIPEKPAKQYDHSTLVKCRSIYPGYMNFSGPKTKTVYRWANSGDVEFVEYQDLRAAMLAHAPQLYEPYIIIDEDEALAGEEWRRIRELYASMYSTKDLKEILSYPADKMAKVIQTLPASVQRTLANYAKTMMDTGEFDSIKKVHIIDELLGTDLKMFLEN